MNQSSIWRTGALAAAAAILLLASCADYPVRNLPLSNDMLVVGDKVPVAAPGQKPPPIFPSTNGYRYAASRLTPTFLPGTLVIVTASGGGSRAAALELGVLKGLANIKLRDGGGTLADNIDIISSVSGGSVTAAYFARYGAARLDDLRTGFLSRDGIGAIASAGLNPIGLARLSTPQVERIDLLIDYFDKTLFQHGETFSDLEAPGHRPYLILNAGDMVEGVPFAFTQANFDLLCSDMTDLKLSVAVAASAAFPVALSPVTLKNYSQCPLQTRLGPAWPPVWANNAAATPWGDAPDRAELGRVELDYARGHQSPAPKDYIHLLDGGIADNLGVAEPVRILTTDSPDPGLRSAIANGFIKHVVVVMINARSFSTSDLDSKPNTPGILDMGLDSVFAAIDQASAGSARRLRSTLETLYRTDPKAATLLAAAERADLVEVNFDAIGNEDCRKGYHNISTSWTNSPAQIDGLIAMGQALLAEHPSYDQMLSDVNGTFENDGAADPNKRPKVSEVCAAYPLK